MADITYKKEELLIDEVVTTTQPPGEAIVNFSVGSFQTQMTLNQDILIIEFDGTEYICEAFSTEAGLETLKAYGGISSEGAQDFSIYPFIIGNEGTGPSVEEMVITEVIGLYTENPGTYTVKIYTAVEDTDSTPLSPTDFIIAYLMASPQNSNWNVLSTLLGDGDWSQLKAYVETTPKNMNRQVLKALLGGGGSSGGAVVGTAVVGTDVVG